MGPAIRKVIFSKIIRYAQSIVNEKTTLCAKFFLQLQTIWQTITKAIIIREILPSPLGRNMPVACFLKRGSPVDSPAGDRFSGG